MAAARGRATIGRSGFQSERRGPLDLRRAQAVRCTSSTGVSLVNHGRGSGRARLARAVMGRALIRQRGPLGGAPLGGFFARLSTRERAVADTLTRQARLTFKWSRRVRRSGAILSPRRAAHLKRYTDKRKPIHSFRLGRFAEPRCCSRRRASSNVRVSSPHRRGLEHFDLRRGVKRKAIRIRLLRALGLLAACPGSRRATWLSPEA